MTRAALFVVMLAVAACHHALPPPRSQFPSPADALRRMKESYACATGVKGEARIDEFSARGRVRGRLFLFASLPDRLRFDVMSPPPFNSIVATLAATNGNFELLDLRDHHYYEGRASACNIARLTNVPLESHVLVSLLGGRAPLLVHQDAQLSMEWNQDGFYVVRIPSTRGAIEEIHIAPVPGDYGQAWSSQRVRVLDVRVAQQGTLLYHAAMDAHAWASTAPPQVDPDGLEPPIPPSGPPCTVEVPRKIHIEAGDQDVLFRYDDVKLNPPLPPGVFTVEPPQGMQRERVECER